MHIFALLPLSIYFFFLFRLNRRRHPVMLDGGQDFSLLAFGLFGFVTLGPGKLLLPLDLISFWGFSVWFFWTAFYFAMVHVISQHLTNRIIIYRCPRRWFMENFPAHLQTQSIDVQINGNVLFIPDMSIQCMITGDRFDGHVLLVPTEPLQEKKQQTQWNMLGDAVKTFCLTAAPPMNNAYWLWDWLAATIGIGILVALIQDGGTLFQNVQDLWF